MCITWTSESQRAHIAKFYSRHRLIRSVLRASKFSVFVISWVYYVFGFSLVLALSGNHFNFLNDFALLRITDEGSLPEMRIWSILLINIKSLLLRCLHNFKSDLINNIDHMRILGTEPSSVILSQTR